ncbi:hypothetical protein [Nocardioides sp. GY 10127]|uniref:hypothetical protein n=1 Tax=Nocardioides sp. GY 10127 TaxID=2569762 RepID=UPI0010A76990|nr:hypothetical protein [Nocardioides sp. GY 10127]TIC79944.1 hypothetical protein E8D37_14970 [Nocardioides sp. GY 10127]
MTDADLPVGMSDGRRRVTRRGALLRRFLLLDLVLLIVASLGVTAWLVHSRTPSDQPLGSRVSAVLTGRDDVQVTRDQVAEAARAFMLRVNTYGPGELDDDGTMPDYRADVSALLTPAFSAEFDKQVTVAEATVAQAGLGRTTEVYSVGVSSLADTKAVALVTGEFTNTYPGKKGKRVEDESAPYRVEVTLRLIDGEWLVDDFTPVTGAGVTSGSTDGSGS